MWILNHYFSHKVINLMYIKEVSEANTIRSEAECGVLDN